MSAQNTGNALGQPLNSVAEQIVLPSPPPTLPAWAKIAWYLGEAVAIGISWKLYDYGQAINGAGTSSTPDEWRRFVAHFSDGLSNSPADDQQFTVDIVNYTNGRIDSSWTQADYDWVTAAFDQLGPSFMPKVVNRLHWDRVDAYRMAFNDMTNAKPFAWSGPPEYTRAYAVTGGDPNTMPPQPTSTITERTLTRKNWGRLYLPTLGITAYDSQGRLNAATGASISLGYHDFVAALAQQQLFVVVPATQSQKSPLRVLQGIQAVAVDDVTDVIRRRRFREPLTHWVNPLAQMGTMPAPDA